MRVAVVYRVAQSWRVPVFSRLSKKCDFKLFYGCDFPGTKVVSTKETLAFPSKRVFSFPITIKKSAGNMLIPLSPGLLGELRKFKPDVVVCEGASNFLNNILVYLYCRFADVPMVQWGLGEIRGRKKSLVRKLLDPLIVPVERRAAAVISYSSYGRKYYSSLGISDSRIFTAVNVVDTDRRKLEIDEFVFNSCAANTIDRDGFNVIFIGALEENKKIEVLISAFAEFSLGRKDAVLHIVGDGSFRQHLQRESAASGAEIRFHGRLDGPLIDHVYGMDVFIMPGLGGLAVSDMLCHGVPVVCGIGDGCELDLIDGKNGIVDDNLDEQSILAYLTDLYENTEKLNSMKSAAWKTTEIHNINNYVESIMEAVNYAVEHSE